MIGCGIPRSAGIESGSFPGQAGESCGKNTRGDEVRRPQTAILLLVFVLIAAGISLFLTIYQGVESYTILDHVLRFSSLIRAAVIFGAALGALFFTWWVITWVEGKILSGHPSSLLWKNFLAYLPFGFSILTPLLLRFYMTANDLKTRLNLFAGAMIGAFILIKLFQWNRRGVLRKVWERFVFRFEEMSPKKRILVLFLASFAVYHLSAWCLVSRGLAYSGDEPYYLLTTQSLYRDGDINLANNYEDRDYFHFYPKKLYPDLKLRPYARFGRKGTNYVWPINQPGISVLILPYYWLSRFFQGRTLIYILKVSLALWAVLLGLQVYLFAKETWKSEKISLLLWFLYAFSAPVLFYAVHLYPELPVALFSLYVFRKVRSAKPLSLLHYFFLGFLVALFPWFGLKYLMILWPLILVSVYYLFTRHRARIRIAGFLVFPVLSLVLFGLYTRELYGTIYPMAIYEGVLTSEKIEAFKEMAAKIPLMLRVDSFLDYFLDQRDGLLLYSPIYFFFFLGMFEAFRKSKKDFFALLFISLPYLFNYAFFSHRQGYSPQGRVLANISWVGAIFIGYFLVCNRKKIYSFLFGCSAAAGLVIVVLLLKNPSFLYQPTTHQFTFRGGELFVYLSNLRFYLPAFLPSFIKVDNLGYIPNYVWLAGILVFAAGYVLISRRARKRKTLPEKIPPNAGFLSSPVLVLLGTAVFFLWFVLFPRMVLLFPVHAAYPTGDKISFYDLGRDVKMKENEPGRFIITKDNHRLDLFFTSWRKIESLQVDFGSTKGDYRVVLEFFDEKIYEGVVSEEVKSLLLPSPHSYRYRHTNLYLLSIEIENRSGISTAEFPFLLTVLPVR
jgi:hypothetical protein